MNCSRRTTWTAAEERETVVRCRGCGFEGEGVRRGESRRPMCPRCDMAMLAMQIGPTEEARLRAEAERVERVYGKVAVLVRCGKEVALYVEGEFKEGRE